MKLRITWWIVLAWTAATNAGSIEHLSDGYVSGFYENLVVQGNQAFVANVYGMAALDIADPANISLISYQPTPGYTYSLGLVGERAYLADWQDDFLVVDTAIPQTPQVLQALSLPGEMWEVDVSGNIAAVACGSAGVYLLDISNPDSAIILSNVGIGNFAVDVAIHQTQLFVAGWDGGVFSFFIGNPAAPFLVDAYTTNPGIVRNLDYQAGFLYVTEEGYGLEVLYADAQGNLNWVGGAASVYPYFRPKANGDRLYICAGLAGLKVYNITLPDQPTFLYTIPTDGEVWGAMPDNDRLWVADGPGGLLVYDISGGGPPSEIGHYPILGHVLGVANNGNAVYAAAKQDGLQCFELSVNTLEWRGGASTSDSAGTVTLDGNFAYVACGDSGVDVFDISSPYAPVHLTTVDTPGFARRMIVAGDTGWVADKARGATVLNISDPGAASVITSIYTMNRAMGLAVRGDLLFVADSTAGLTIFNVANLGLPILLGGVIMPHAAMDVALYGDYALVADFEGGLRICDISSASGAFEAAHVDLPGHAERVSVNDHWALVTLHDKGIAVIDLTDPVNPVINAYQESPGSAVDMVLIGQHLVVADTYCMGLYSFDATPVSPTAPSSPPGDFALLPPYPNPFNPSTTVEYSLAQPGIVTLAVYDLSGQLVKQLISARQSAGSHQAVFDGSRLASGVYIVSLKAGSFAAAQKFVLLK